MRVSGLVTGFALALAAAGAAGCTADIRGAGGQAAGSGPSGGAAAVAGAGAGGAAPVGGTASLGGPGRVVMHRLNVAEYNNTVRDLLLTEQRLSENFPPDDTAFGFDNVAAALSMTDVTLGYYIDAAKKLAAEALSTGRRDRLVTCDLAAGVSCVTTVLEAFLPRAWRRPVQPGEVERLVALYSANKADSATDDEALGRVLQAVLLAPQFLYRIELNSGTAGVRPLDGYELASRLSYFLWSSTPDQELYTAAASGALLDGTALSAQVSRLLADGKAAALGERFGNQWLNLRSLENVQPDAMVYPGFDAALRAAMREESMRFFADVAGGQRPLGELFTTTSGYVNARLAQHYGVAGITSESPVFTALPPERGGILTQASILTVLAHPTESAPVLRGKWILSQFLCQELPPPPPDVPQEPMAATGTSRRERLKAHREEPICRSCHEQMDPLGLALENYDGIGAYRTMENGAAIDPSGTLVDGTAFSTPQQLASIIARNPALPRCVAQHLFTYGLGRAPRSGSGFDSVVLDAAGKSFADAGQLFPKLVDAIVASDAFRTREDEALP
jgi:hypothetical protein